MGEKIGPETNIAIYTVAGAFSVRQASDVTLTDALRVEQKGERGQTPPIPPGEMLPAIR